MHAQGQSTNHWENKAKHQSQYLAISGSDRVLSQIFKVSTVLQLAEDCILTKNALLSYSLLCFNCSSVGLLKALQEHFQYGIRS